MGQAFTAISDDASAVFWNPAGLATQHKLSLMHNHSARHMPRHIAKGEVDQLDGDTQAVVFPIAPCLTAAAGFNFQGEMGYDYRRVEPESGLPDERFAAVERFEGLGLSFSPWTQVGAARRSFHHRFENSGESGWSRVGDGYSWGIRQWVAPGVTYGYAESRADFDSDDKSSGRIKRSDSGWAVRPAGWLLLAWDKGSQANVWREEGDRFDPLPADKTVETNRFGAEINLAGIARLRCGLLAGQKTFGFEWTLPNLRLWYTEAENYLDRVIGASLSEMRDVHLYGFVLTLP
jgi:hypothetical protein